MKNESEQFLIKKLGIDCETKGKAEIIRRLKKLKTTVEVIDLGTYKQDQSYSLIHVDSNLTEQQLENWLYKNNFDYIGTFTRSE